MIYHLGVMVEEQIKIWKLKGFGCHSTLIRDKCNFTNYTTSLWHEGGGAVRQRPWPGLCCGFVHDSLFHRRDAAGLQSRQVNEWRQSGCAQSWGLAVGSPGLFLFLGSLRCWFNVMRFPCLQSFQKLLSNLNIPQLSILSYKTENNLVIYLFKLCCCFLICCHCQWYSVSTFL